MAKSADFVLECSPVQFPLTATYRIPGVAVRPLMVRRPLHLALQNKLVVAKAESELMERRWRCQRRLTKLGRDNDSRQTLVPMNNAKHS